MSGTQEPKVHLAIDNCFASKRWTEPEEWMEIAASIGLCYVEASADTECDPLYHGEEYLKRWIDKVTDASAKTGVRISSIFSGHGSYTTLGMAHTDPVVRRRFLDLWLKPMIRLSAELDAGMGFFCHAFPESVMREPDLFREKWDELADSLAELTEYAGSCPNRFITLEQMYSPNQVPWTIHQAEKLIQEVYGKSGKQMYITIDTGHMYAQKKYYRPSGSAIREMIASRQAQTPAVQPVWTGCADPESAIRACGLDNPDRIVRRLSDEMDECDYQFADIRDSDPYEWIRALGLQSPIIHLQQTNGSASSHLPFTEDYNRTGTIAPDKLIAALQDAYAKWEAAGQAAPCRDIYLTFEIFSGKSDYSRDIINRLRESVEYWREWIPEDGVPLGSIRISESGRV